MQLLEEASCTPDSGHENPEMMAELRDGTRHLNIRVHAYNRIEFSSMMDCSHLRPHAEVVSVFVAWTLSTVEMSTIIDEHVDRTKK